MDQYTCDSSVLLGWHEKPAVKRFVSLVGQTARILQNKTGIAVQQLQQKSKAAHQHVCYQYFLHKVQQEEGLLHNDGVATFSSPFRMLTKTSTKSSSSSCLPSAQFTHKKTLAERILCGPEDFVVCQAAGGDHQIHHEPRRTNNNLHETDDYLGDESIDDDDDLAQLRAVNMKLNRDQDESGSDLPNLQRAYSTGRV